MKTKQLAPHPLRIPPEMKAELQKAAVEARRSLSAEILIRLERTLKEVNPSFLVGAMDVPGLEKWAYHPETRAWTERDPK